jgi:hypothetical protein
LAVKIFSSSGSMAIPISRVKRNCLAIWLQSR